jgi:hypothetical protein
MQTGRRCFWNEKLREQSSPAEGRLPHSKVGLSNPVWWLLERVDFGWVRVLVEKKGEQACLLPFGPGTSSRAVRFLPRRE